MSTLTADPTDDIDDAELDGGEDLDLPEDTDDDAQPCPPLTREEVEYAFRRATSGFAGGKERWAERAAKGMTDEELAEALKVEIGIFGGRAAPACSASPIRAAD